MAKIIKTNEQETALKEIINSLKTISSLTKIIESKEEEYKINVASGKLRENIIIPGNYFDKMLKDYRKKLSLSVKDKAKTFNIVLDDADIEVLSFDETQEKGKNKSLVSGVSKEQEPEEEDDGYLSL